MTKLLLVEDDLDLHFIICKFLMTNHYTVQSAYSGDTAYELIQHNHYDLIVLDLMLPGITGETFLVNIRQFTQTPVMILSSKASVSDRVWTLQQGADDYLTKPFEKAELLARIEALLRRSLPHQEKSPLVYKNIALDQTSRVFKVNEIPVDLTSKEFALMSLLMTEPSKVFTKNELFQTVWQEVYLVEENSLNVHISNLRKKIKPYDDHDYIETVWGIGFKLT